MSEDVIITIIKTIGSIIGKIIVTNAFNSRKSKELDEMKAIYSKYKELMINKSTSNQNVDFNNIKAFHKETLHYKVSLEFDSNKTHVTLKLIQKTRNHNGKVLKCFEI